MTRPLFIFDIDGTLAVMDHALPLLDNTDDPDRYRKFHEACDRAKPNRSVVKVLETLKASGADIWFFSGRSDVVLEKTIAWLTRFTSFSYDDLTVDPILVLREEGDRTPDHRLKEQWYNTMLDADKQRLVAVFEDRQRVVDMWRRIGVTCCQVAKGDF